MRRLALLLAFLIAAPAIADPPWQQRREDRRPDPRRDRDRDRDKRPDVDRRHDRRPDIDRRRYDTWHRRARDVHHRWITLNTTAESRFGRMIVTIPSFYLFGISDLRIEHAFGTPMVSQIEVIYDNGIQRFMVNSRLLPGQGIEVQLDPYRRVRSIVLYTNPRYRGGVTVWGK